MQRTELDSHGAFSCSRRRIGSFKRKSAPESRSAPCYFRSRDRRYLSRYPISNSLLVRLAYEINDWSFIFNTRPTLILSRYNNVYLCICIIRQSILNKIQENVLKNGMAKRRGFVLKVYIDWQISLIQILFYFIFYFRNRIL